MKKMWFLVLPIVVGSMIMLNGCTGNKLEHYKEAQPTADLKTYFNGPIKAWGLIQDWRGKVLTRFDVDMVGSWEGNQGVLEEEFRYYNGDVDQRVWKITQLSDDSYEGSAGDILGKATGAEAGNAIQWKYQMDVPVGDRTFRLTFDDWMWQMNDGIMINRSYLKKFGITVAELTLFMQKQEQ